MGKGKVPQSELSDVVVVGAGIGGLAAAAYLALAGHKVTLLEGSRQVGGRARTQAEGEFRFNLGPHGLPAGGEAARVLRELGIAYTGNTPPSRGVVGIIQGKQHIFPVGLASLLRTRMLSRAAKVEYASLFLSRGKANPDALMARSVRDWVEQRIRHEDLRTLFYALFRLTTYCNDPDRQSAGAALAQLRMVMSRKALYLDGGWQTIVDGLSRVAQDAGAEIHTGTAVTGLVGFPNVVGVELADLTLHRARHVILAVDPKRAAALLPDQPPTALRKFALQTVPCHLACLDIALARLPHPKRLIAFDCDRDLYYSVHSSRARLAPTDGALIHVAKYLHTDDRAPSPATRGELEDLMDTMQPGWRNVVVKHRFLPRVPATNAMDDVAHNGTHGRPGPVIPEVAGLYAVGDWIGPTGMWADASLASAKLAASAILNGDGPQDSRPVV